MVNTGACEGIPYRCWIRTQHATVPRRGAMSALPTHSRQHSRIQCSVLRQALPLTSATLCNPNTCCMSQHSLYVCSVSEFDDKVTSNLWRLDRHDAVFWCTFLIFADVDIWCTMPSHPLRGYTLGDALTNYAAYDTPVDHSGARAGVSTTPLELSKWPIHLPARTTWHGAATNMGSPQHTHDASQCVMRRCGAGSLNGRLGPVKTRASAPARSACLGDRC